MHHPPLRAAVMLLQQPSAEGVVSAVVSNPAVQAAAVHVMEAAHTEVAALKVLSATPAPAPQVSAPVEGLGSVLQGLGSPPPHVCCSLEGPA